MPALDFRRLRAAVSMAEVLQLLHFEPRTRRGQQWRGPCPVHESTSPRSTAFSANLAKNTFRCFKCGAAGNHLDLWALVTKQPLFDAALQLCDRLRRDVPYLHREQRRGTRNNAATPPPPAPPLPREAVM